MRIPATVLALVAFGFAFAQTRTELISFLSGSGKGKAVFKTRGSEAELQVEAENLRRNTTYRINVANGKVTGTVTTNSFGRFEMRRAWRGTFPKIRISDPVVVRLASNGSLVQSGNFRIK